MEDALTLGDPSLEADTRAHEAIMERLVHNYKGHMLGVCKDAELTPPQFWALVTIRRLTNTKMSPLADSLGLSMGAASTLVDRLVTRGLVERAADAADRRAVHVSLSPRGQEVVAKVVAAKQALVQRVLRQLDATQRQALIASLDDLAKAWEALPAAEVTEGVCGIG